MKKEENPEIKLTDQETMLSDLREIESFIESLDITSVGNRISLYKKLLLNNFTDPKDFKRLQREDDELRLKSKHDAEVYLTREIQELQFVLKGLKTGRVFNYKARLQDILNGAIFAHQDSKTKARDTQFELRISSYLALSGLNIDLSSDTDVVVKTKFIHYYIECKRVARQAQLYRRLKKALSQIESRIPKNTLFRRNYGIVFIDCTQYVAPKNSIAIGSNTDQIFDTLRTCVTKEAGRIRDERWEEKSRSTIMISVHTWTPFACAFPPIISTFSTHQQVFRRNASLFQLFATIPIFFSLRSPNLADNRTTDIPELNLPENFVIPEGTSFIINEDLLHALHEGRDFDQTPDETTVAEYKFPNEERVHCSFAEFKIATANLTQLANCSPETLDDYRCAILKALVALHTIRNAYRESLRKQPEKRQRE